jgi:hypothetical protein
MSELIPLIGDFSFLDADTRVMLDDAYKAISIAEAWD